MSTVCYGTGDPGASLEESTEISSPEEAVLRQKGEDIIIGKTEASASSVSSTVKSSDRTSLKAIEGEKSDGFGYLPEHEAEILIRQIRTNPAKISFLTLFRYATRTDKLLIFIYCLTSIGAGAVMPLMTVLFGSLTDTFKTWFLGGLSEDEFRHSISHFTIFFIYLAVGEFALTYFSTVASIYCGEHITRKIRENYLRTILRQNTAFFDSLGAGEITTRITSDTNLIQTGISEKISLTLVAIATFISAYVIGFTQSWKLTLILTSTIVAIFALFAVGSLFIVRWTKTTLDAYAKGGTLAEEVLSTIRNAQAFGTQDRLADQYNEHLMLAEKWGIKKSSATAVTIGGMFFVIYATYALAFWQGSRFLVNGEIGTKQVVTVLLAIMIGAFSLGNVAPNSQAFTAGLGAASKIFETIDRVPYLDCSSVEGERPESCQGTLRFKNTKFIYPSRPEVLVLSDFNLEVPAGKTTALVGASGSGKSTVVGLVERFYDSVGGIITLDGKPLEDLNVKWLRQQISLVSQEPTLFGTTIYENVAFGLMGTVHEQAEEKVKRQLVKDACEFSNAHGFISALPDGYETNVGERGFLLSGGQKQRIAIARAVVSDPKILLLDEATSALDVRSECVVQDALDRAAQSRTTIVIAHRLSTIRDADNIVVMSHGDIVEQGTHDHLLSQKGSYYELCEAQKIISEKELNELEIGSNEGIDEKEEVMRSFSPVQSNGISGNLSTVLSQTPLDTVNSKSSNKAQNTGEELADKHPLWTLIKMTASFNTKERWLMALGLAFSVLCGAGNPISAYMFAQCISAISLPLTESALIASRSRFWALLYFVLSLGLFLSYVINGVIFAFCSEKLIRRVRDSSFRSMLRQDIAFFDQEKNTVGALTSTLSIDTTNLAGMSGVTLNTIISMFTTIVVAIILSLSFGWKLALVCTSTVPLLLACGYYRFHILAVFETRAKDAYERSASFACEATSAIRTVASLTREDQVWWHYHESLRIQAKSNLKSILRTSVLYALSQSLVFLIIALGFWYGGTLIASGEYTMQQFFICFIAITFGAQSAGTVFSFSPDMGKARHAAESIKTLLDRLPEIDYWSSAGNKTNGVDGHIEFRNVHFRYPTRRHVPVLRGLNLIVKPGQYIALVGPSGCGKSTTISLTERFYDPESGTILLDGEDISSLNLNDYRSHISLVSQEPTLYQGTIKDNVLLGSSRDVVSQQEIETACKNANIHDFILSLPQGYNTMCGQKGAMLSGGQKQRVAIARALIRQPKVLLLDEATSALDSESEKVVQKALDVAAKGRTTIAVAHRLSTIQDADFIYVFDQGKICESGDHAQLMASKGRYFELVQMQNLEKRS